MSTITRYTNSGHKFIIDGYVAAGNTVTITVVPIDGYRFSEWLNDDGNRITELDPDSEGHRIFSVTIDECGFSLAALFQEIEDDCDRESIYNELVQIVQSSNSTSTTLPWDSSEEIDCDTIEEEIIEIIGGTTPPTRYILTVNANTGGTATGGGTYSSGTNVAITAIANPGYTFTQWDDGNTSNPRQVTVTGNATYTAYFTTNTYTITTGVNPTGSGTATGGGSYAYNTQATLTATANSGYTFTQWSDGNTSNPRQVTVTGNATYTAEFTINSYTITTGVNPTGSGAVSGGGSYAYNTQVTLTATANPGYTFTQWSDGNTSNPRQVTVTGNAIYTAEFTTNSYTITTGVNPRGSGTVTGGGSYAYNTQVTLTATANPGYTFTQWSDGNTSNPRQETVTGNATYTANFSINSYIITTGVNPTGNGAVSGGGTYAYNTQVTLTATANPGYVFTQWSDGNTSNPRQVTVTGNATYIAEFKLRKCEITTGVNPRGSGTVTGGGSYVYNDTATLTATANPGYTFTQWDDGNTSNPRQVTVTGNATYIAEFSIDEYTITTGVIPDDTGTVTGGGTYAYGTQVTLTATGNPGYVFTQWSDGDTNASRTITVRGNATYKANFSNFEAFIITTDVSPNASGITTGDGTYVYGTQVTLTATANPGYSFTQWSDGDTNASRIITVRGNVTYTAYFESDGFIITPYINPFGSGKVTGGGKYSVNEKAILTAIPNDGYNFSKWDDGDASNPRTITVTGDKEYTAEFTLKKCEITTKVSPEDSGTVTGGGTYVYGDKITLKPTANAEYVFTQWDDGDTSNPRTITVTGDKEYTAEFKREGDFVIRTKISPEDSGTVEGGGNYPANEKVILRANPNDGYVFSKWDDENTESERDIIVTEDMTYIAYFNRES